jgi:hypothetical protein
MLVETCRDNLLKLVRAYRGRTREPLAVISKRFYGNRAFLDAFKRGKKSITLDKFQAVTAKFRACWPDGLPWPHLDPVPPPPGPEN